MNNYIDGYGPWNNKKFEIEQFVWLMVKGITLLGRIVDDDYEPGRAVDRIQYRIWLIHSTEMECVRYGYQISPCWVQREDTLLDSRDNTLIRLIGFSWEHQGGLVAAIDVIQTGAIHGPFTALYYDALLKHYELQ